MGEGGAALWVLSLALRLGCFLGRSRFPIGISLIQAGARGRRSVGGSLYRLVTSWLRVVVRGRELARNAVAERLGIGTDRSVVDVAEVGNTSAASIPIALDRAWRAGRVRPGDLVLLTSFGAGLSWGANLIRWTGPAAP